MTFLLGQFHDPKQTKKGQSYLNFDYDCLLCIHFIKSITYIYSIIIIFIIQIVSICMYCRFSIIN